MSGKKDSLVNIGGWVAVRDQKLFDDLRNMDSVPRDTRHLRSHRLLAEQALTQKLRRCPTEHEVCEALGWTPEQLRVSFWRGRDVEVVDPDETPAKPQTAHARRQTADAIAKATEGLGLETQVVLYLWYACGMKPTQIASAIGLSVARVRQIKAEAVKWLRENRTKEELIEVLF